MTEPEPKKCGVVSPMTNVPCDREPHSDMSPHGASVLMPDGRVNDFQWAGKPKRR